MLCYGQSGNPEGVGDATEWDISGTVERNPYERSGNEFYIASTKGTRASQGKIGTKKGA